MPKYNNDDRKQVNVYVIFDYLDDLKAAGVYMVADFIEELMDVFDITAQEAQAYYYDWQEFIVKSGG